MGDGTVQVGRPAAVRGTDGDDRLRGGGSDDRLVGLGGDDRLGGAGGDDVLWGGRGADILRGGGGDDIVHGGAGLDTALLSGGRDAYRITQGADGRFTVESLAGGFEGVDTLDNVERIRFGDGDVLHLGGTNAALSWNRIALDTIGDSAANPLHGSRALAIESLAVLEIVDRRFDTPGADPERPADLRVDAAVAAAAHAVLSALFPGQKDALDFKLAADLADVPDGSREDQAVAYGRAVAEALLASRRDDGSGDVVPYQPSSLPGRWEPTLPGHANPIVPQWATVDPFLLDDPDQFRPGPPPAIDSDAYAADFDEVFRLGGQGSTERTAEQTEIALFWNDGSGSYTPPGHWNAIADGVAEDVGLNLRDSARMLATLNLGLADAGIASWDAKYAYDCWRPVTAIRRADEDGNAATEADPAWTSLITTPPHPEYVSGHSTFSAAAATILTDIFGDLSFTTTSETLPGVTRSFDDFWDAAGEAGQSRIYGGIHFQYASTAGRELGEAVGQWAIEQFGGGGDL